MRLRRNYRNTVEIARFAAPLVEGLAVDDDATIPDFSACVKHGPLPVVLVGRFSSQTDYAIRYILDNVDLARESVAFLHPRGGGYFDNVRSALRRARLDYIELTRRREWPLGPENIGLSTLHSAKGLEFDHIVAIGLNAEMMPHGPGEQDDRLITLRRLVAMGIGRARKSVILGYKFEDASVLFEILDPRTYQRIEL